MEHLLRYMRMDQKIVTLVLTYLCYGTINADTENYFESQQLLMRTEPPLIKCPTGWTNFSTSCYLFGEPDDLYVKKFAERECETKHQDSYLVSVANLVELNLLRAEIGSRNNDGFWLGMEYDSNSDSKYKWTDGTPWNQNVSNEAWGPGSAPDRDKCPVFLRSGKWLNKGCGSLYSYLCKIKRYPITTTTMVPSTTKVTTTTLTTPTVSSTAATSILPSTIRTTIEMRNPCPIGWLQFSDFCYYFSERNDKVRWRNGDNVCNTKKQGAFLASVATIPELNWLKGKINRQRGTFWLGGYDDRNTLGSIDYKWSDRTAWNKEVATTITTTKQTTVTLSTRVTEISSIKTTNVAKSSTIQMPATSTATSARLPSSSEIPTTSLSKPPTASTLSTAVTTFTVLSSRVPRSTTSQDPGTSTTLKAKATPPADNSTLYIIMGVAGVGVLSLLISVIAFCKLRRNKRPKGAQPLKDESLYGAGSKKNSVYDSTDGMGTKENPMYFALDGKDEALIKAKELAEKEAAVAKEISPC